MKVFTLSDTTIQGLGCVRLFKNLRLRESFISWRKALNLLPDLINFCNQCLFRNQQEKHFLSNYHTCLGTLFWWERKLVKFACLHHRKQQPHEWQLEMCLQIWGFAKLPILWTAPTDVDHLDIPLAFIHKISAKWTLTLWKEWPQLESQK
jgi:hypothetical protein